MNTRTQRTMMSVSINVEDDELLLINDYEDEKRIIMHLSRRGAIGIAESIISGLNQLRDARATRSRKRPRDAFYSAPLSN